MSNYPPLFAILNYISQGTTPIYYATFEQCRGGEKGVGGGALV